ncbi:MAG: hypothetical protein JWQ40_1946 [Segetibacter sp.]|jgi:ferritin-like metal-binding protein YciE|nr:hypothetical protein [Segetibacter sp.]
MQTINDLADLLFHNIQNLYAAEEQMSRTIPSIIEKVHHNSLKNALTHHSTLTGEQKNRLKKIVEEINVKHGDNAKSSLTLDPGFVCKGMKGLIEEANELLESNPAKEVTDAGIIACVQKMEHYEISTYGTALAYVKQLHLHHAETLLAETLDEEYDADDLLTALATAAINKEAVPKSMQVDEADDDAARKENDESGTTSRPGKVSISERSINSPGGRAGTSHRRYGSGESRGH